jgi:excinuclease ABC subunit B
LRKEKLEKKYKQEEVLKKVAEEDIAYLSKPKFMMLIENTKKMMFKAAKETDFMEAARLRDEMQMLEKKYKEQFGG